VGCESLKITLELTAMAEDQPLPVPVHTANTFEDLSGVSTASFSNPYDALLSACNNDPVRFQTFTCMLLG
jgi:hypothetical protein